MLHPANSKKPDFYQYPTYRTQFVSVLQFRNFQLLVAFLTFKRKCILCTLNDRAQATETRFMELFTTQNATKYS